jgi:hypothetical protein
MCNPLAALTAIRGLGKSTELVHFPASKEYLTFVAQGQPHPPLAPVVSVVTYGSGMDGVSNSIGLRIIYGAICAMGLAKDLDWVRFATKYQHVAISVTAAVQMVREGYGGESRRVLLCVDDLYKAGPDDEAMMKELGTVLTFDGDCDIVVTSLSQKYLMQLTHRLLTFVPVLPLASTAYPLDQHVQAILQMCPLADLRTVPDKVHILRSVHILASGHPRTLAHLERILQSESTAAELADALKKPANEFTCFQFLWKLCGMLVDVPACLVVPEYAGHVQLILSTTSWYGHHERLHSAVCKGVVQLCGPVDRDNCRPSTTLAIFLQLAVAAHNPVVPFQFPEPTQLSTTVAPVDNGSPGCAGLRRAFGQPEGHGGAHVAPAVGAVSHAVDSDASVGRQVLVLRGQRRRHQQPSADCEVWGSKVCFRRPARRVPVWHPRSPDSQQQHSWIRLRAVR